MNSLTQYPISREEKLLGDILDLNQKIFELKLDNLTLKKLLELEKRLNEIDRKAKLNVNKYFKR